MAGRVLVEYRVDMTRSIPHAPAILIQSNGGGGGGGPNGPGGPVGFGVQF